MPKYHVDSASVRSSYWALTLLLVVISAEPGQAQKGSDRLPSLDELNRRLSADSTDPVLHVLVGRALLQKGRHDEAERRFRHAASLAPGSAEAYLGLAAVPMARSDGYWRKLEKEHGSESVTATWTEASRLWRLAFLLDPLVNPFLIPKAQDYVELVDGGVATIAWYSLLTDGINAFRKGDYEKANRKFEELRTEASPDPDGAGLPDAVLWYHGLVRAHLDDFQGAATDFTVLMNRATTEAGQGIEIAPLLANDYRYMAGTMLSYAGQDQVATLLLQEALVADPSLFMAHSRLARIHERGRRWDVAVLERQRAVDANPENADLVLELGLTLLRAGRPEPALEAFQQAARLNPGDPRAAYHVGLTALRLERPEIARTSFDRFLGIAPKRMVVEIAEARRQLEALR